VGDPEHANTHPFRHGAALLIHNGHVPAFDAVRPRLLDRLSEERRSFVRGSTDSEHVFALLLQVRDERPDAPLHVVTREAIDISVQRYREKLKEPENHQIRLTDCQFASVAGDDFVLFGLPTAGGSLSDTSATLVSETDSAVQWGTELFEFL